MGWKKHIDEHRWNRFQYFLKSAFGKIKSDIGNIGAWIKYFHDKNQEHDERLRRLEQFTHLPYEIQRIDSKLIDLEHKSRYPTNELQNLHVRIEDLERNRPMTNDEIRQLIDGHYSIQSMAERIRNVEEKMNSISYGKPVQSHTALQQKVLKTVTRNSKEYVKNLIMSLIQKYEKIAGLQMKDMVVDEQGLCSKSSFYRLLQELEFEGKIGFLRNGKEKVFYSKVFENVESQS
ncbi:hypothetical protein KY328_03710 [Candidatus Woesearchaeota archaeon]|nr:hypothetical protein [Candidatus Woesearchaeota archaeon]MBW3022002.1 hypothetical protein [Candidatus Woesearchaeota archaeon]